MGAMNDYELIDPPKDGISSISFSNSSNNLMASSWSGNVHLYDALHNKSLSNVSTSSPVLNCTMLSKSGYFCSLNGLVNEINFERENIESVGSHSAGVKALCYSNKRNIVISGGWDRVINLWSTGTSLSVPERVYAMDTINNYLVVGLANKQVLIYDLRNTSSILQKRESSLKFQTRSIKCFPDGEGYATSSIEGRISIDFFETNNASQSRRYAFKCHRKPLSDPTEEKKEIVYPVNALAFHPKNDLFVSGGSDGVVNLWDRVARKRIKQYRNYPSSISSLDFNSTGDILAIASSYCFEEGQKDHLPDSIFIKKI